MNTIILANIQFTFNVLQILIHVEDTMCPQSDSLCYYIERELFLGVSPRVKLKAYRVLCVHQCWYTQWFHYGPFWGFPCVLCELHQGSICRTAHSLRDRPAADIT